MTLLIGILRWTCGVFALAVLAFLLWSILRAAKRPTGAGVGTQLGWLHSPLFYIAASAVFFGLCAGYHGGSNIRVTFLVNHFPRWARLVVDHIVQVQAAPTLVVIGDVGRAHVSRAIDQQGFGHGRAGHGSAV